MSAAPKLTHEQREILRRRWEGCEAPAFDWLAREALAAWGVAISRQALTKAATKGAWCKGGPSSQPLATVVVPGDVLVNGLPTGVVAQPVRVVAGTGGTTEPAGQPQPQPVALLPGQKPLGYAGTGRPSAYRPEYAQQIIDFFNVQASCQRVVALPGGATRIELVGVQPPMLVRFAQGLGVSVETIGRWANDTDQQGNLRHPEFADAYGRARRLLESLLVEGATIRVYDTPTVVMALKNWHGWKDHPEYDAPVAPVSLDKLDELYIRPMAAARARQAAVLEERRRQRNGEAAKG